MGNPRYITGEATITPPLTDKQLADIQTNNGSQDDLLLEYFTVEDSGDPDRVELINGEVTVIEGTRRSAIGFGYEEPGSFYDFEEACAKLATACAKHKVTIEGSFTIHGEENTDISRVRFLGNGKIADERPKLVWPNGDEEDLA